MSIDPEIRRRELAEAVWRVILRDGLANASVRNVAQEAGLSVGSLRHYFHTQTDLLTFSMRLVGERIGSRLWALDVSREVRLVIDDVVHAVLPLDETSRRETQVWLAFAGAAQTEPELRALSGEIHDGVRILIGKLMDGLAEAGLLRPSLDLEQETERLHALVDGLAIHGVVRPDRMPADRIRSLLAHHLDELVISE